MSRKGSKTIVSVSLDTDLLKAVDVAVRSEGLKSRSKFIEKKLRELVAPDLDPLNQIDDLEA